MPQTPAERNDFASRLLAWYDANARDLPWRVGPSAMRNGARPDPYRVFLSEIMLQQTTVEAVKPRFGEFLGRWPDIASLAQAPIDDVMRAWAGLGYYSRARNLHKAAQTIEQEHGGNFPQDAAVLKRLPGIGDYTAAAIAAIAFGGAEAVVDGNVERVIARHFALEKPLPQARAEIRAVVARMVPGNRPGDFAQGMMDLGATVCMPRRTDCNACPVAADCLARANGEPERLPLKAAKPVRPLRRAAAYVAVNAEGEVLLRRRPDKGLLAGMAEPPTSAFTARSDGATGRAGAPFAARWTKCGEVDHVFTHFALKLDVWRAFVDAHRAPAGTWWASRAGLDAEGLPTVMKKAVMLALNLPEGMQ
jgi:A/G-specific adenine glycosylase